MDAWNKSLTWGLGGDQVRIMDRKVEGLLLAAESFDAIASTLGARSQAELLDKAWKDLLASQSHDVGLCEYSRWQGDRMAPPNGSRTTTTSPGARSATTISTPRSNRAGRSWMRRLKHIAARINSRADRRGPQAITVFNPLGWPRTDVVTTGRIYPIPAATRGLVVRNRFGPGGPLADGHAHRRRRRQPGGGRGGVFGHRSAVRRIRHVLPGFPAASRTDRGDGSADRRIVPGPGERAFARPARPGDRRRGGLVDKRTGREMLDAADGAFPRLTGRPNPNLSRKPNPPAFYDSAKSKAQIDWLAKGPLWAEVRAQHSLPYLQFETRVSLAAGAPYVEVYVRMLCQVPPHSDAAPANIKEGYWLSLRPAFPVTQVLRDFPFGVEETKKATFHALTFVDLLGQDGGTARAASRHAVLPARRARGCGQPRDARVGIAFHARIWLAHLCRVPLPPDAARDRDNSQRATAGRERVQPAGVLRGSPAPARHPAPAEEFSRGGSGRRPALRTPPQDRRQRRIARRRSGRPAPRGGAHAQLSGGCRGRDQFARQQSGRRSRSSTAPYGPPWNRGRSARSHSGKGE